MEIVNLISTASFLIGIFLFFYITLPPIHLINDPNRREKEKGLINFININRMTIKEKIKLFAMLILSIVFMSFSTLLMLAK